MCVGAYVCTCNVILLYLFVGFCICVHTCLQHHFHITQSIKIYFRRLSAIVLNNKLRGINIPVQVQ